MDPDAPWNVAQGTVLTSLTTSLLASGYGTFKRQNPGPLALATALNSGIAAATFFSFREYIISPLLLHTLSSPQYIRRKLEVDNAKGKNPARPQQLSWGEMRTNKLFDSAVSGALTGGVLNAWRRGRAGIASGATTATIVCTLLQAAYNELDIQRIKYVSRKLEEGGVATISTSLNPLPVSITVPEAPSEPSEPFSQRFFEFFGMPKISDEEYLKKLKAKRETYLRRIAELEAEKESAKRASGGRDSAGS